MAIVCPYNPKESSSLKYWCRWEGDGNGRCPVLVGTQAVVQEEYEGRLALFDEPGSGTYTVILNQLTTQDAGFYWCLTNGDSRWRTTVELQVTEGESRRYARRREETEDLLSYLHPCRCRKDLPAQSHISMPVTSTPSSFNHHLPHFLVSEGLASFAVDRYLLQWNTGRGSLY